MSLNIDQMVQLDQISIISGDVGAAIATVKPASTAAIATDTAIVTAMSPNSPLPAGTNTLGKTYTLDGVGNPITSDNNGNSADQRLHIAVPDTTVASTALGALNATISIAMSGLSSVGFQLLSGTLIGTIIAECSVDGGTTWTECNFYNPASSSSDTTIVFSTANTVMVLSVLPIGGSSHVRVRVSAYTSGTANSVMRASEVTGPVVNTNVTLPTSASQFSFGQVTTSASTTVPVEFTVYTEPTSNSAMTLVSASANDTSAGTGARTVTVTYLDSTMSSVLTTTFTMNGTTSVTAGVSNMCYVRKIVVTTVGSTGSNVGILTLKTGGGATVGTIGATSNQTFWAHHYTPTGKTTYISGLNVGTNGTSASQGGTFFLKMTTPTIANTPSIQVSDFLSVGGAAPSDTRPYGSPIQVIGPARITAYVTPGATSSYTTYASFDFIDN